MPVFFVVALANKDKLKAAIREADPDAFELKDDSWFMKYEGTARAVADKLGIISGASGNGVVVPVGNYSGRAPADLWEWLKLRISGTTPP